MPLVRKPAGVTPDARPDALRVIRELSSQNSDERWAAARNAASLECTDAALALALRTEEDSRVREAMLTSLARLGTPVAIETLLSILRSNIAAFRTAALDALRVVKTLPAIQARLLGDPDPDVRILSCELARSLPATQSSRLLCELIDQEKNVNVCAAAIDVLAEVGDLAALTSLTACAQRFREIPFLLFAIATVSARINASASARD